MFIEKTSSIVRLLMAKDAKEVNRGVERYRKAFKTSCGAYASQLTTILVGVITTPLLIGYLGNERYGLMISATSLFFFFGYLDLGYGIGIQNAISRAHGRHEYDRANIYGSTGLAVYLILAVSLAVLSQFLIPHLPLEQILKTKTALAGDELVPTVLVLAVIVSIGLVGTYVQRLCDSLQQGYLTRFAAVASRIVSLVLIIAGVHFKVGLPVLVLCYIMPSIASIFAYGLLLKSHPWMKPQLRMVRFSEFREALGVGVQGLGAVVAYSLMLTTVPLIISSRMGAASVIEFAVANQLVMLSASAINNISTPFWPAIAEAMGGGDIQWVRKASRRFGLISVSMGAVAGAGLLLLGRPVIYMWTHNTAAVPSMWLLASMSICMILLIVNGWLCTILNGLNRFRGQALYGTVVAVMTVAIACFAGFRLGVVGISWTFTAGFLIRCICLALELRMIDRRGLFGQKSISAA